MPGIGLGRPRGVLGRRLLRPRQLFLGGRVGAFWRFRLLDDLGARLAGSLVGRRFGFSGMTVRGLQSPCG